MLVDWFTVAAQALNFLVLVWLLKRLLYRPVLAAIDAREQRISVRLEEAAARETEALRARDALAAEQAAFARDRAARLSALDEEIAALRTKLTGELRDEAEAERQRLRATMDAERRVLQTEGRLRVIEQVFAIARQVLRDLADETLEARLAAILGRKLQDLPAAERAGLCTHGEAPIVRSAFPLPAPHAEALAAAIATLVPACPAARFELAPDLLAGAEIVIGAYRFAWHVSDYFALLGAAAERVLTAAGEESASSPYAG